MTLTRSVAPPPIRRHARWLQRWIVLASLISVGAVGHRAATAIFTASRTTDARASAEYEIRQMLDSFATRHIGASSCDIALAAFVASTGGSELRDPWERPYAPACVMDGSQAVIVVASGGPDCRLGTPDDIIGTAVVR